MASSSNNHPMIDTLIKVGCITHGVHHGNDLPHAAKIPPVGDDHPAALQHASRRANAKAAVVSAQHKIMMKLRLVMGLLRAAFGVLRPWIFLSTHAVSLLILLRKKWREQIGTWLRTHRVLSTLLSGAGALAWAHEAKVLMTNDHYRQVLFDHDQWITKSGLFFCDGKVQGEHKDGMRAQRGGRMTRLLKTCNFFSDMWYEAPWLLRQGDLATVMPALTVKGKYVEFNRVQLLPHQLQSVPHGVTMDWSFPPKQSSRLATGGGLTESNPPILVVCPGVGGDTSVAYIRDMVYGANQRGWTACVVLARGLGNGPPVLRVEDVFDPSECTDLREALVLVSKAFPESPIMLQGASLGAVSICNFLGRYADEVPPQVIGAVAVSATFNSESMHYDHYEKVYQPMIVASLVDQIVERYSDQLDETFLSHHVERLLNAKTYSDLFSNFYNRIFKKRTQSAAQTPRSFTSPRNMAAGSAFKKELEEVDLHANYTVQQEVDAMKEWQDGMEGAEFRHRINVPLFVLAARDDPFHGIDVIGFEATDSKAIENPNVAYFITPHGGHIGWPTSLWPKDFGYMTGVTVRFMDALLDETFGDRSRMDLRLSNNN